MLTGKDIKRIKKEGKILHSNHFSLVYLRDRSDDGAKLGIIVSQRVSKKAVLRNKGKRMVYESVRMLLPQVVKGYNLLFLVKGSIFETDVRGLKEEIFRLLRKTNLI